MKDNVNANFEEEPKVKVEKSSGFEFSATKDKGKGNVDELILKTIQRPPLLFLKD